MKHSKVFLLILIITVLALAVSACAEGAPGSGGSLEAPSYKGKRVPATIFSVDGENVVFMISSSSVNISISTLQSHVGVTFQTDASVPDGITYETKEYHGTVGNIGDNMSFVAAYNVEVKVSPELLSGFAAGDSVYVTFDEEGNVTKIEERTVSSSGKDDKKEENEKDGKDEKDEKK